MSLDGSLLHQDLHTLQTPQSHVDTAKQLQKKHTKLAKLVGNVFDEDMISCCVVQIRGCQAAIRKMLPLMFSQEQGDFQLPDLCL